MIYGTKEVANVFGESYFQGINERWAARGEGVYLGSKEECVLVLRSSINVPQGVSLRKIHHYHHHPNHHHHHQFSMLHG